MPLCTMQREDLSEFVSYGLVCCQTNDNYLTSMCSRLPTHPDKKAFTFCPGGGGGHFHLNLYATWRFSRYHFSA